MFCFFFLLLLLFSLHFRMGGKLMKFYFTILSLDQCEQIFNMRIVREKWNFFFHHHSFIPQTREDVIVLSAHSSYYIANIIWNSIKLDLVGSLFRSKAILNNINCHLLQANPLLACLVFNSNHMNITLNSPFLLSIFHVSAECWC